MIWQKVSAYCIASGPYRISKVIVAQVPRYEVYHGTQYIGEAKDGKAARHIAEQHDRGQG